MKKFSHALLVLVLILTAALTISPAVAIADETDGDTLVAQESINSYVEFDLTQAGTQTETIQLPDGTLETISITYTPLPTPLYWEETRHNVAGTIEVSANSLLANRGFTIVVDSGSITNAYGEWYSTGLCTVTSERFTWDRQTASYRLGVDYIGGVGSRTLLLNARMIQASKTLVISGD